MLLSKLISHLQKKIDIDGEDIDITHLCVNSSEDCVTLTSFEVGPHGITLEWKQTVSEDEIYIKSGIRHEINYCRRS